MLEVRDVLPAEYDEAGDLIARIYVDEGWSDEAYGELLRDISGRSSSSAVLVALLDGELVGTVTVAMGGTPFAQHSEAGEAEIRMLATTPAARGVGAGTALTEACIARAREAGATVVRLSTQPGMTAAHRIYERLGFVRTPDRDWSPVPDLELMTYALPLVFCGQCGEPGRHETCERLLALEPPRYCARCRRRMVVQVHPTGWSARCVEHGVVDA